MEIEVEMKVEMKDIKGYEGLYAVTTDGRVYSYRSKKFLSPGKDRYGYFHVTLCNNGTKTSYSIHRLVAEAFIPNSENKETVDHIDRNRTNNNVENLRWTTYQENDDNRDQERMKQHLKEITKIAAEKNKKKTAMVDIKTGKIIQVFNSCSETAISLGDVGKYRNISNACNGKRKTAYGYSWKYIE